MLRVWGEEVGPVRKPASVLVGGRLFPCLTPASSSPVRAPLDELRSLKRALDACGAVSVDAVEGGFRVRTSAGAVCGGSLEDALVGAVARFEDSDS